MPLATLDNISLNFFKKPIFKGNKMTLIRCNGKVKIKKSVETTKAEIGKIPLQLAHSEFSQLSNFN